MPQLQFHESGRPLFVYVLRAGRTVIGRADSCDLALPSESVSRVQCVVDQKADGFVVSDRSRHGTHVNGVQVPDGYALQEGDELGIGIYRARFANQDDHSRHPTATVPMPAAIHEELLDGTEERVAACRAELRFVRGPHQGTAIALVQPRTSVGGPGATVELDPKLPRGSVFIRVVRGRPMIEPGLAAAYLAGTRLREVTPALSGEEVRVGEHGFVVEITTIEEAGKRIDSIGEMVGRSEAMGRLFGVLHRMAAHDAPVLLCGESGTGKELAARALHDGGPRAEGPFVALNSAAIVEQLFESELFGHVKGAFTGATAQQDGAFQRSDGGTLFLDEIGEMRLDLQAKLLRVLESGEVRKVGATEGEYPDVRVVAATNRNLPEMVRKGTFRQDLYFRLAVLTLRIPSLRERPDDIPVIAQALLARHHAGVRITPEALTALGAYRWPGNVRELRNVLTRAVVLGGPHVTAGDLQFNPWSFDEDGGVDVASPPSRRAAEDDPEREGLVAALAQANGNRTHAARLLGIPRSSLLYKLNKYGLQDS